MPCSKEIQFSRGVTNCSTGREINLPHSIGTKNLALFINKLKVVDVKIWTYHFNTKRRPPTRGTLAFVPRCTGSTITMLVSRKRNGMSKKRRKPPL